MEAASAQVAAIARTRKRRPVRRAIVAVEEAKRVSTTRDRRRQWENGEGERGGRKTHSRGSNTPKKREERRGNKNETVVTKLRQRLLMGFDWTRSHTHTLHTWPVSKTSENNFGHLI